MHQKSATSIFYYSLKTVACLVLLAGIFTITTGAQCVPAYSQESFRKVYRNNKMFFEGLADITGDGKPDAYGYELQANNTYKNVVMLPNDGNGGFGDPIIINGTFQINNTTGLFQEHRYGGMTVGDLNGDGKQDFVLRAATTPSAIFTFISDGKGGYTQSVPTFAASDEYVVFAGDVNGDGRGDLVTETLTSFSSTFISYNNLGYRLGNADGSFGPVVEFEHQLSLVSPLVADFNGDGKPDISYTYYGNPNGYHLKVLINQGGGFFNALPTQMNVDMHPVGAADFNGDGKLDIYGRSILTNNGQGVFTGQIELPSSPAPDFPTNFLYGYGYVTAMDYDGDGKKDLVAVGEGQAGLSDLRRKYYETYISDGTGSFTKSNFSKPFIGLPADMNGDGKDDQVIFINSTNGSQRASGTNETAVVVRENTCTPQPVQGQTKLVDFGGDGISDIALWKGSSGQWHYISNMEERTFNWGGSAFGDIPIPGDYDGDGKTDAAVFRASTGDWWILKSSDASYMWIHWGATGDIPIPRDYNGDGKSDIAVFRPSDGNWYIWYTDTDQYNFLHFGATGDIPIPADFDGDGADNVAVFRPSSGDWFYLTSTFDNFVGLHWGATGDIPIPGDYDMDGKADIAVFRPSDQNWYIFRSYDLGFDFFHFGSSGDIPMLVDSDGDGALEITTYRPPGPIGQWYASNQPLVSWGYYGGASEKPLRLGLSNQ